MSPQQVTETYGQNGFLPPKQHEILEILTIRLVISQLYYLAKLHRRLFCIIAVHCIPTASETLWEFAKSFPNCFFKETKSFSDITQRLPKTDVLEISSSRQKLLWFFCVTYFEPFQVAFCAIVSNGFDVLERKSIKRYSQMSFFFVFLFSAGVTRLEQQVFCDNLLDCF